MATFEIQGSDGKVYQIDAPDQNAALEAFSRFQPQGGVKPEADMSFMGRLKDNLIGVDDGVESGGEYLGNLLNKGGQGLMFGFGDEADAAARSAYNGKSYDENLSDYREQEAAFEDAHPVASTVAEVGGAVLPVALGVGAVGPGVRAGAKVGAAQGAAYGFGNGEGAFGQRAQNSALGMLLGGAVGGGAAALGKGIRSAVNNRSLRKTIADAAEGAPTGEQLRAMGNAAYQRIDDAGVQIKPEAFDSARRGIVDRLRAETGFDELPGAGSLTPNSARVATIMEEAYKRMAGEPTAALPFKALDQMRRQAGAAAGNFTNKTDQAAGAKIIEGLDDFIQRMEPEDVVAGDVQTVKSAIPEARELWGRMRRSQMLDDAIAQEGNYLSGGASAIRNQFAKILRSDRLSRGYSEAERAAMRRVVQGGPLEHTVNLLGGGLGGLGQMGLGAATGGLPGAVLGAATSAGARKLASAITRRNAETARAAVASGKLHQLPALPQSSVLQQLLEDTLRRSGVVTAN